MSIFSHKKEKTQNYIRALHARSIIIHIIIINYAYIIFMCIINYVMCIVIMLCAYFITFMCIKALHEQGVPIIIVLLPLHVF